LLLSNLAERVSNSFFRPMKFIYFKVLYFGVYNFCEGDYGVYRYRKYYCHYGYSATVSFTPYDEGVTKSDVVAAPASGVSTILTVVLGTRFKPE